MEDLKSDLISLIENEMCINLSKINPDKDIREQIDLDSMQMISLSAKVEEKYDIELPLSVMNLTTLNEFLKIVECEFNSKQLLIKECHTI